MTTNNNSAFKTIMLAGFVAGLLDIAAAIIKFAIESGQGPTRLFQFIASGIFGREAFTGGTTMVVLGLLFHFALAFIFAIFFFIIYPKISFLSKNKVVTGLVYGALVWVVMNLVVLPFSNAPKLTSDPRQIIIGMAILMFCIGLPISLIVHRYYSRRQARLY